MFSRINRLLIAHLNAAVLVARTSQLIVSASLRRAEANEPNSTREAGR